VKVARNCNCKHEMREIRVSVNVYVCVCVCVDGLNGVTYVVELIVRRSGEAVRLTVWYKARTASIAKTLGL
jgi:hypothetical protein